MGIGNAGGVGGTPSSSRASIVALDQAITAGDETNPAGSEHLSGLIEVNAAIEPGDSGGPLVNDKGKVVGMDTAGSDLNGGFGFDPDRAVGANRGYAIPINTALSIVTSIRDDDAVSGSTSARRRSSAWNSIRRPPPAARTAQPASSSPAPSPTPPPTRRDSSPVT